MRTELFLTSVLLLLVVAVASRAAVQPVRPGSVPHQVSSSGAGNSHSPVLSGDGRFVAFLSQANNLTTNDDLGPHLDLFLRDLVNSNTVLLSISTNRAGGANDNVFEVALSSNAQFAAFETAASNLAPGDTNRYSDIYVRDRVSGNTILVSVNANGTGSGNGPSSNPLISEDGRYVVFESLASNLVVNDLNGTNDIFIRDLAAGTTTLVSLNATETASADGPSHSPSISADGLSIAFVSRATNIVPGVTNQFGEVYLRDAAGGSNLLALASHLKETHGSWPFTNAYVPSSPILSADGRFVLFKTLGAVVRFDFRRPINRLALSFPMPTNPQLSNTFYFYDNPRLSVSAGDGPLALTPDGRFSVYSTLTINHSPPHGVLRLDYETLITNAFQRFSAQDAGCCYDTNVYNAYDIVLTNVTSGPAATWTQMPWIGINSNASRLSFLADATNLVASTPNRALELYSLDLTGGPLRLLSSDRTGKPGPDLGDVVPAMSADGSYVAWDSPDENVVPSDSNRAWDVFVRNADTGEAQLVSARAPTLSAVTGPTLARLARNALSADGSRLAVLFHDSNLMPNDTNNRTDLLVRNLVSLSNQSITLPELIQLVPLVFPPVRLHAASPMFSANGRYLAFAGEGDLSASTFITNLTLFWRDTMATTNRVVASGNSVSYPIISPDGRFVAFHSPYVLDSFNSDGNGLPDVFEYEFVLSTGLPAIQRNPLLVSASREGWAANGASGNPSYSPDGSWIVFQSLASDLTSDYNTNPPSFQLFARQRLNTVTNFIQGAPRFDAVRFVSYTTVASSAPSGSSVQQPLAGGAANSVFSGDSRYVLFESGASNLIYRHDLRGGYVTNITPHPEGPFTFYFTNRARVTNDLVCTGCASATVSGDGRLVAYETRRGAGAINDVMLKDMVTGAAELVSATAAGGAGGNGSSFTPLLSHDSRYVVFASRASDLVPDDRNRATDIFVRDRLSGVTHCISRHLAGAGTGNRVSSDPVLSADGRTVAFQSFASDLATGDYNSTRDVFVVTLTGPDTDGDGLDDDWEMTYFDTLQRDGKGDFDGDNQSDGAEFRAGTNPSNNASVLRVLTITSTRLPSTQIDYRYTTLLWTAVPGKTYRVQFKQDYFAPWTNLAGDVIAGGTTGFKSHEVFSPPPWIFYRVVLVQ